MKQSSSIGRHQETRERPLLIHIRVTALFPSPSRSPSPRPSSDCVTDSKVMILVQDAAGRDSDKSLQRLQPLPQTQEPWSDSDHWGVHLSPSHTSNSSLHCVSLTHRVWCFRWLILHRRWATSSASPLQSQVQPAARPCRHRQYCSDTTSLTFLWSPYSWCAVRRSSTQPHMAQ